MYLTEFDYHLPEELIAQSPPVTRGESRLLYLDGETGSISDYRFAELNTLLRPGDLLVFNDTCVIPARLYGYKASGGKAEIMLERIIDDHSFMAQVRSSKTPKTGSVIYIEDQQLIIESRQGDMFVIRITGDYTSGLLFDRYGHMPLPPYIKRQDEAMDRERYQTIYAKSPGAVAAPTAGLHFTREQMHDLSAKSIESVFITLHVGAGTFQPVRVETIEKHKLHGELIEITEYASNRINLARENGNRIIAVGTTSVRAIEAATDSGVVQPYQGETDIFIYPGFKFQVVDAIITNFHLPESSLLMLVCAFAGKKNIFNAYQHAITEKYRFYSYGDAMFITRQDSV